MSCWSQSAHLHLRRGLGSPDGSVNISITITGEQKQLTSTSSILEVWLQVASAGLRRSSAVYKMPRITQCVETGGQARSHLLTQLPPALRQSFDGLSSLSGRRSQSRPTFHPFYLGRNRSDMLETESCSGKDPGRLSHIPDLTVSRK